MLVNLIELAEIVPWIHTPALKTSKGAPFGTPPFAVSLSNNLLLTY
jgi:hypothetical protein